MLLISAVTGMGGIGKTALAVEAAHQARAEGWFPGGFLFVDLRGYDDDPATADQAVVALLDAMGVRGTDLPPTAARQYDVYRSLLTERRDPTLLILDNASDPSQYLPLLPGTDHHRVLITSRDRPDALPVRVIDLEALAPDESAALITRALRDADERDDRPTREPASLHELADLCGHLPLALQIAAAMLRRQRHRGIASLVEKIRGAGDPTTALDNGSPGTDLYGRSLVLRPVLETSYRRLPDDQARLLRLLCLAPGAETTTEAVAALAALEPDRALSLLEDLAATHLVTPVRDDQGRASMPRWRSHDLVRAYGTSVVARDAGLRREGEVARQRVLEFYVRWADAATHRLRRVPGGEDTQGRFATRQEALRWLDGERAGLVAAARWAAEAPFTTAAVRLALGLGMYLEWRRLFDDWITVAAIARTAAHRAGDHIAEARAWNHLGIAMREAGRAREAVDAHTRALALIRATGGHAAEARVWNYLGLALLVARRLKEAASAHTHALELFQAAGDVGGEADAWSSLGISLGAARRPEEALTALARARDLYQAVGDRLGEANAWANLAFAQRDARRMRESIEAYDRSLGIFLEFENWYGAGQTLEHLAMVHEAVGAPDQARVHYLRAFDAFTRANASDRAGRARAAAASVSDPTTRRG
ncbi:tetratricopeptide repeat protein [Streptomyces sp. SP18BB07]|uniref:tetratricopeptide repeat protein n=1 Tax=Streptomyces sp. SP18BB07 TaxID=3002522 RepID=UPI002E7A0F77|nr:tetratricopeptide repeat protein [Streptomyces sp. SP18BB07]MEE1764679.1 tetratricopeptide repeat protein [Streptomyces sp. SP18BB07]